jgi:hypothetical protein
MKIFPISAIQFRGQIRDYYEYPVPQIDSSTNGMKGYGSKFCISGEHGEKSCYNNTILSLTIYEKKVSHLDVSRTSCETKIL